MYIYPHNEAWKSEYTRESDAIQNEFGLSIELHHIGSTAISGLHAKDCIDILGIVSDLSEVFKRKERLIALGYNYKGAYGISGRGYFSKASRKVHLHIFEIGDTNIKKHLHFVNVMKNSPSLVATLNSLKIDLHTKYPKDKDLYQLGKVHFYDEIHKML